MKIQAENLFMGSSEVQKAYLGSELIWEKGSGVKVIETRASRYTGSFSRSISIHPITPPSLDEVDYIDLDGVHVPSSRISSISSTTIDFYLPLYSLGAGPVTSVTIHLL